MHCASLQTSTVQVVDELAVVKVRLKPHRDRVTKDDAQSRGPRFSAVGSSDRHPTDTNHLVPFIGQLISLPLSQAAVKRRRNRHAGQHMHFVTGEWRRGMC